MQRFYVRGGKIGKAPFGLKYYELALITGRSPKQLQKEWDEVDINWVLMVHYAQQQARIAIASFNKVSVADVPAPTSVVLRKE